MNPDYNPEDKVPPAPAPPAFPSRWAWFRAKLRAFHWRDYWWHLLDGWEARRGLRRTSYVLLTMGGLLLAVGWWAYPWWTGHTAIRRAEQWLVSGRSRPGPPSWPARRRMRRRSAGPIARVRRSCAGRKRQHPSANIQ